MIPQLPVLRYMLKVTYRMLGSLISLTRHAARVFYDVYNSASCWWNRTQRLQYDTSVPDWDLAGKPVSRDAPGLGETTEARWVTKLPVAGVGSLSQSARGRLWRFSALKRCFNAKRQLRICVADDVNYAKRHSQNHKCYILLREKSHENI